MTPVERLSAAIEYLEKLRDEATPGEWSAPSDWHGDGRAPIFSLAGTVTAGFNAIEEPDLMQGDADLIVALHRTIEPVLAVLRGAALDHEGSHDEPGAFEDALALADAILGGSDVE